MSRKTQEPQLDPAQIAILHRTGRQWRVLVGTTRNRKPLIVRTRAFPEHEAEAIGAYLTSLEVGRAICVLPASSVICRTCSLPVAEPEQLEQALQLQAEAYLPGDTPAHRMATAVLPASVGETSRSGILITWPESAQVTTPRTDCAKTFAPDIAALAALINGYRPSDPLLSLDRHTGAVALAITHSNGAILRSTREEADSAEEWTKSVSRILAETALSVGHTASFVQGLVKSHEPRIAALGDEETALFLPDEVRRSAFERIGNLPSDEEWWSQYGIAAGVFLAATSALAPLTDLHDAPDIEEPTALQRITLALSQPRSAIILAVCCLLLLGLTPLVMSAARLGMLKLRYPDLERQTAAINEINQQKAIYGVLSEESWSMTKILSDIVCNIPEGIDLEFIRIQRDGSSFLVRGEAKTHDGLSGPELIGLMQQRLHESRIFQKAEPDIKTPNNYGVFPFQLAAKVTQPHRQQPYEYGGARDYEHWTLAMRQRGADPPKRGEKPDDEVLASADDSSGGPAVVTSDRGVDGRPEPIDAEDEGSSTAGGHIGRFPGGGGGAEFVQPGAHDLPDRLDIPQKLTIDQIRAMSKNEARSHLVKIARAKNAVRHSDPEEAARLQQEQDWIFARLKEEL